MSDDELAAEAEEGSQIVDVTITAPDVDWLRQHCTMLIERRLAASANIIPTVDSVYRWQGQVHHSAEAYAILHTRMSLFNQIVELTNEAHPYDTSHVIALPVVGVSATYRTWIVVSTNDSGSSSPAP